MDRNSTLKMEEGDYNVPAAAGGTSLIKQLGSCNKMSRDKALKFLLKTWLPSQSHLSDSDMKKLWKGLFYCLWHADKSPVQSDLINRLSSLLLLLDLPLSLHYLSVFLITMRREWPGIDALRLDKFYILIRRFLQSCFILLKNNLWDLELLRPLMYVLEDKTFLANNNNSDNNFQVGNGVNYHIASVFLEEIKPFLPVSLDALDVIFRPFFAVMGKSRDKVLVGKVKSNMFDELLKTGRTLLEQRVRKGGEEEDDDVDFGDGSGVVVFGTIALTMGFAAKFYDLGSSPDCLQGNRKVIFTLHENFLRLEKDLESSGIEILIPHVSFDYEGDVPKLIPIVTTTTATTTVMKVTVSEVVVKETVEVAPEGVNASASKSSKKNRRAKKGLDGSNKKAKTKKNGLADVIQKTCLAVEESEDVTNANGDGLCNETNGMGNLITFNASVISNLQMQFEKVASEAGLESDTGLCDLPKKTIKGTVFRKRKRLRTINGLDSCDPEECGQVIAAGDASAKSGEKSAKKVRFSMKNNLVWKPHSPLPPQSLRLPPSVTPRGSALKKGLPPGPIREMPPPTKKVKQRKKSRKGIKSISPAIKRLRKLQKLSI
ncbi:uncharacterized protein LOC132283143 [Cornus florida]|uniref:uncharacterized protein LOC132283143 n=1 Tax=Cornus florida TaxID=4283 RepID=UPI00289A5E7E|nr:uncharacterized protein LOC132283143 [Cornus florida]